MQPQPAVEAVLTLLPVEAQSLAKCSVSGSSSTNKSMPSEGMEGESRTISKRWD
uniref:Uncharacterized protein n=1 Tax=Serratia marcescens TaxID=615 RepID=A0A345INI2_SERMA|nr:hypothetical protein [Serratia marcescens]